jgi:MFS family permease
MAQAPEPNRRQRLVDGPRLLAGIVVAALAAGPAFFIAGTLVSGFIASPGGEVFRWAEAQALPLILMQAVYYAFLPSILPVTLGAAAMAVLGAMFRGARSWLAWMLAGAILAGLICLLFPDLLSFRPLAVSLLVTGIFCAVICRAFARWPEDADAADES